MTDNFKSFRAATLAKEPLTDMVRAIVIATINRLNLVSREEFEIQTQVLLKTRLRLEQLEQQLLELNVNTK
jgi:ubiquinone biosynthesis accessory factor UbiK